MNNNELGCQRKYGSFRHWRAEENELTLTQEARTTGISVLRLAFASIDSSTNPSAKSNPRKSNGHGIPNLNINVSVSESERRSPPYPTTAVAQTQARSAACDVSPLPLSYQRLIEGMKPLDNRLIGLAVQKPRESPSTELFTPTDRGHRTAF
ncbi:hypothetical protein CVT25_001400 [Psilocybe cyanescens]|uniref:Uncharacterized protein n=1 Tax=Psilocybe cyanescens TaxID=93625 RepID=A0A409XS97_PSICY|nr:hypothetical protein CVT25_001400 [Psilocybe cyanescens]